MRELARTRAGRGVMGVVVAMAAATAVALLIMWPDDRATRNDEAIVGSSEIINATVQGVAIGDCPVEAKAGCQYVDILVGDGDDTAKSYLYLPGDEAVPRLSVGDKIRVAPQFESIDKLLQGQTLVDPSEAPYGFVDFRRGEPLYQLALLFVILVVFLGRRIGAASLLAVGMGLLVLTSFVVPAILAGSSPLAVALVGSFAIMIAATVFVYGFGVVSLASLLGTAISLAATGIIAVTFVNAAHITGTSGDGAEIIFGLRGGRLSPQGLVLAGMIIGALGVLNDVTVSQSSTVLALRRADPTQTFTQLYNAAMTVGRDHLGATVNTLVFAYAGASLPLLLIFNANDISLGDALVRENVATEIVSALAGSIGLIAAVPLTTLAAAALAVRLPLSTLPREHAHVHAH